MKIKLKRVEIPPEEVKDRPKRWNPLTASIQGCSEGKAFETCQRRGLEVVVNTVEDGRVVASIGGHVGVAKSLRAALLRSARVWDKANKPRKRR